MSVRLRPVSRHVQQGLRSLAVLMCLAQGASAVAEVRLDDFDRCSPKEYFETAVLENRWRVEHVPLHGKNVPVLVAAACVMRTQVRLPLDVAGPHQVYVGLYVSQEGLPAALKVGRWGDTPATIIEQRSHEPGPRVEEHVSTTADLTGRDLLLEKIGGRPLRVAYVRLVPESKPNPEQLAALPQFIGDEATNRFSVSLNGQRLSQKQRWFRLSIGAPNELRVEVTDEAFEECSIEVTKTRPDQTREPLRGRVSSPSRSAPFALGPLMMPTEYEYRHGTILRRGYRLEVRIRDADGALLARLKYYQGIPYDDENICLFPGREASVVHGPPLAERYWWRSNQRDAFPLWPLVFLRLAWPPVEDGQLRVEYGYRASTGSFPVVLHIENEAGKAMVADRPLEAPAAWPGIPPTERRNAQDRTWAPAEVPVAAWPPGRYRVSLWPVVDGEVYREGPYVTYVRQRPDPHNVVVSPFADWTIKRDPSREELHLDDMPSAVAQYAGAPPGDDHWQLGASGLVGRGNLGASPVRLAPELEGYYAVFARPVGRSCMLRFSGEPFLRPGRTDPAQPEPFIGALDMTGKSVEILQSRTKGLGLAALRFVPVTEESARSFNEQTENPPLALSGVADWHGIYSEEHKATVGSSDIVQIRPADFDLLVRGHREVGMRTIDWQVGRSFVNYHSRLPNTTLIGSLCETNILPDYLRLFYPLLKSVDPLHEALDRAGEYDQKLNGWLCMNRCYRSSHSGVFSSKYYADHPEWHFRRKDGKRDGTRVSYFFPEIRRERLDILGEVAGRGVDGLLIGFCRQPPMLGYHPKMAEAYEKQTGIDPRTIDASRPKAYLDWLQYRADIITTLLRTLRRELDELEKKTGRHVRIIARIPGDGLLSNLAAGLDVERWCREGLVDQLQVDPLVPSGGGRSLDIRPYIELARQHNIKVYGGINEILGLGVSQPAFLRRAIGLARAGVDGIEIYESEQFCSGHPWRFMAALAGHPERAEKFLDGSNLEACYPHEAWSVVGGMDNHFNTMGFGLFHAGVPENRKY